MGFYSVCNVSGIPNIYSWGSFPNLHGIQKSKNIQTQNHSTHSVNKDIDVNIDHDILVLGYHFHRHHVGTD